MLYHRPTEIHSRHTDIIIIGRNIFRLKLYKIIPYYKYIINKMKQVATKTKTNLLIYQPFQHLSFTKKKKQKRSSETARENYSETHTHAGIFTYDIFIFIV